MRSQLMTAIALLGLAPAIAQDAPKSRIYDVRQTVTLRDIPKEARVVRMWIAVPRDAEGQKVLDLAVASAPGSWSLVEQNRRGNRFLFVEAEPKGSDTITVTTTAVVRRDPIRVEVDPARAGLLTEGHRKLFADDLDLQAPNMVADARIKKLADDACKDDVSVMGQVTTLWTLVADLADHYSKDKTKPSATRGNAEDCLARGGGGCTDMHSLFVALARARGIPVRIQFGYRLQAKNDGKDHDPGYRCWVEYFVPNYGWIPTDIVVGDSGEKDARAPWITALDERRVVLCEGRDFELTPKASGPRVNNMIIGYAEIDGQPVPLLTDKDGKASPLSRSVFFTERKEDGAAR